MSFQLRDYQLEALDAIQRAAARGVRRQLVVAATGWGKTILFASLPEHLSMQRRMLVLAHREELLEQAAAKLRTINPHLRVEIEQGARRAEAADVIVASVATLGHKSGKRLAQLDPADFELVVVDEAHHAVAPTYRRVLEHMGCLDEWNPDAPLLLGVTATPERGDEVGLAAIFEEVVYERHLRQMITDGWLVRIRAWRAETGTDLSGVHTRLGDYVLPELSQAVNTPARNFLAVRSYEAHALGRRAVAFCVDVQHARDVAQMFSDNWIPAAAIDGSMASDERREILQRFAAGDILVLANCMILTEGFDEPQIGALLMMRPTKSRALYTQCLGRGTRLAQGKEDLVVIDLADVTSTPLPTAASLLGLPLRFDCQGRDALEQAAQLELLAQESAAPNVLERALSIDDARRLLREVDIIGEAIKEVRAELKRVTKLAWMKLPNGVYYLALPENRVITAREDQLGHWQLRLTDPRGYTGDLLGAPNAAAIGQPGAMTRDAAMQFADTYVRSFFDEAMPVLRTDAAWRKRPASPKFEALMRRMHRWRDGMTAGEASDIFNAVTKKRKVEPQ